MVLESFIGAQAPHAGMITENMGPSARFLHQMGSTLREDLGRALDTDTGEHERAPRDRFIKVAGASVVVASFLSEATIGNELPTLQVVDAVDNLAAYTTSFFESDVSGVERAVHGGLAAVVAGTVTGTFTAMQQYAYGSISRIGLKKVPETMGHMGTLKPREKDTSVAEEKRRQMLATFTFGTSVALADAIARDPSMDDKEQKELVKRSARYLGVEWALLAALLVGGSATAFPEYAETIVDIGTSPNTAITAITGYSILKSWGSVVNTARQFVADKYLHDTVPETA